MKLENHLLVQSYADDPMTLRFDKASYVAFRNARFDRMWKIAAGVVNL